MSGRAQRRDELVEVMSIETTRDGASYITLHGVALGCLTRLETGQWRCEWRSTESWYQTPTTLEQGHPARAEPWATEEVADSLAMEEQARREHEGSR
jgi:hypothetical protein